jgi:hypothetical protein
MTFEFTPIEYKNLNPRQQENYNFQKFAGRLADYGFNCLRLTDDWKGADFIAIHAEGEHILKVQLKGRLTIAKKYINKNLHIAFRNEKEFYIYGHDEMLCWIDMNEKATQTKSWLDRGLYDYKNLSSKMKTKLKDYKI